MKKFFSIVLCTVMIAGFPVASFANEEVNYGYLPYQREIYSEIKKDESTSSFSLMGSGVLPEKYDSRDYGYVSPVKDQGTDGACWTFAAAGACESYLLKFYGEKANGKVINTNEFDISENHIRYMSSSDFNNPLGYCVGINSGGNTLMSSSYFLNDFGPVWEDKDSYSTDDKYKHRDYSATKDIPKSNYKVDSVAFVQQYPKLGIDDTKDALIKQTKRLVMEYGSAVIGLFYPTTVESKALYFNTETSSLYYYGSGSTNHQVLIVGWDDTYSKDNFITAPERDGAFIIKNSWGTGSGDNGYFYVSYCDYNLFADVMAITSIVERNNKEIVYNLDPFGMTSAIAYSAAANPVSYGNSFQKKTSDELLTAVSMYAFAGVTYKLYLFDNAPVDCEYENCIEIPGYTDNRLLIADNVTVEDDGYCTVRLDSKYPITSDKFSIVAEADSEAQIPMPLESNLNIKIENENKVTEIPFINKVTANEKESFYLSGNSDIFVEYKEANFCIKAITETSEPYADFELANFTDENGTIKTKSTLNEGETVYAVPAMNYTNISDKQIICVGYKNNQMKMMSFKNIDSQNRFKFENIPSDFKDYTFYMYVWGLNGLKPVGQGISVGN